MKKLTLAALVAASLASPAFAFDSSSLKVDGTALDVAEARGVVALVVQWATSAPSPKLARIMAKSGGLDGLDTFAATMARGADPIALGRGFAMAADVERNECRGRDLSQTYTAAKAAETALEGDGRPARLLAFTFVRIRAEDHGTGADWCKWARRKAPEMFER